MSKKLRKKSQKIAKKKKKRKFTKTKRGNGWNKKSNMSNNAVKAFNDGFITWGLFSERYYFIGEEITALNNFISCLYVRHHIGSKMKETYMFPPNILELINSDDPAWFDFKIENQQLAEELVELSETYNLRKYIIESLINKIKDYDENTSKEEIYKELCSTQKALIGSVTTSCSLQNLNKWATNLINTYVMKEIY